MAKIKKKKDNKYAGMDVGEKNIRSSQMGVQTWAATM